MEGSNYYAPEGMNSGRRNDNRYHQQQQYPYGRPNLSQEHQLFQENQLRNNNDVYNYSSHLSPGKQPSIYPPQSLQHQQNIHKSSRMKMMQNQQFTPSPNKLYPPSPSNRPPPSDIQNKTYNEFTNYSYNVENFPPKSPNNGNISSSPSYNHLIPTLNFPSPNNERPSQPSQNKEFSKFPPSSSYNQMQMRPSQPSRNKAAYSPPPSYNQIPSTKLNNQMHPPPQNFNGGFLPNPSPNQPVISSPNGRIHTSPSSSPNIPNPSPNPISNPSPITPQPNNEKSENKIQGQVDHSIPPVERSLSQLTSLEQVWDMPLVNDGKPTWKFWFCKIFIILLVLACSGIGISVKATLNNFGIGTGGLIGNNGNETSNEDCNVPPDCGKSLTLCVGLDGCFTCLPICPLDGKKPSKKNS